MSDGQSREESPGAVEPSAPTVGPVDEPPSADAEEGRTASDHSTAARVVETIQTIVTALILAFVFRAFFVEAFIIPTGSMAESLHGVHGTALCPYCGWEHDFGPVGGNPTPTGSFSAPAQSWCPNCQRWAALDSTQLAVKSGDRILVHKWPYLFGGRLGPQRWDVIVFRDPANPAQNYIKRLVGLPGESVEIIDGDVYIDGKIARKTPAAQSVLWFIVFDQDHLPRPVEGNGARSRWVAEEPPGIGDGSGWRGLDTRVIRYGGLDETPRAIAFDAGVSNRYFQDGYGYNNGSSGATVRDVRMTVEVVPRRGDGWWTCEIARPPYRFTAHLERAGKATLLMQTPEDEEVVLGSRQLRAFRTGRPVAIEFAHVDYRVYLKINGREVLASRDAQYSPSATADAPVANGPPLQLRVTASALDLELRGLRIDRDVYYTYRGGHTLRAYAGKPFALGRDEYFVLGDNSPSSADGREWYYHGRHLPDDYRLGTVPADQIVGQAFFVYLPGLMPLDNAGRWRIQDIGRTRFIR